MALKKTTQDIVSSSVMLGVGGTVLHGLGQGGIATQTIGKAATGLGVVIPAAFGFEALRMIDKRSRRLRRR